jgi:hypothetical protein
MINTNTLNRLPLHVIARRIALPLVLFSAVFLGLLILSWGLLLPSLTQVTVGGVERDARSIVAYHNQLAAQVSDAVERRHETITSSLGGQYEILKERKYTSPSFFEVRESIQNIIASLVPGIPDSVFLSASYFSSEDRILSLKGYVHNVGPRSMTVLAQLVESVERLPSVISLKRPRFDRREDPDIGFYSPFHLQISL